MYEKEYLKDVKPYVRPLVVNAIHYISTLLYISVLSKLKNQNMMKRPAVQSGQFKICTPFPYRNRKVNCIMVTFIAENDPDDSEEISYTINFDASSLS